MNYKKLEIYTFKYLLFKDLLVKAIQIRPLNKIVSQKEVIQSALISSYEKKIMLFGIKMHSSDEERNHVFQN